MRLDGKTLIVATAVGVAFARPATEENEVEGPARDIPVLKVSFSPSNYT